MSGIYIKGLKMPDKCINCFFNDIGTECGLLEHDVEDAILRGKRYGGCPLLPVPDHGDLIDREVVVARLADWSKRLIETYGENDEYVNCLSEVLEGLNCDDVIIPAERSEE